MKALFEKSVRKIQNIPVELTREHIKIINWKNRLIGLTGARGTGKTTIILQYIIKNLPIDESCLYVSLDNIYFAGNNLLDMADKFVKNGGKYLFLDEVHRYKNWSQEIKNIYDDYPELKVVFTGSSVLQIRKSSGDLSRRAVYYTLPGLSLREYIRFTRGISFQKYPLEKILKNHVALSGEICAKIKPIALFNEYLKYGYYPYFLEGKQEYMNKLAETINTVLETDLPSQLEIPFSSIEKLKKLLYLISVAVPFTPNIQRISERTGITRNTIVQYLHYLHEAQIINLLFFDSKGISMLQKPDKIYLHHPNLQYALCRDSINKGSLRESFFCNQLRVNHNVTYPDRGDFMIDNKYTFEIGGKNKDHTQIAGIANSYISSDDIEIGYKNSIPLWLFGFLY